MAHQLDVPASAQSAPPVTSRVEQVLPRARAMAGERYIARVLKTGALLAGACFALSVVLEILPTGLAQGYVIDALRKGGLMLLVVTPIVRLAAAGVMLGLRGEYRYTVCATLVLLLLAMTLAAGFGH